MIALVVLSITHIFMVFAVDPYSLRSMITGGYDESKSPERRNARPLWWKKPALGSEPAPLGRERAAESREPRAESSA
jgi:hypothetical protein